MQQTIPFSVQQTEIELQDYLLDLDEASAYEDETLFKINKMQVLPYELDSTAQMDITFEMDLSQNMIMRKYYNFFDYLAEIGGLKGSIFMIFMWFLSICNHNMIDNFMVS